MTLHAATEAASLILAMVAAVCASCGSPRPAQGDPSANGDDVIGRAFRNHESDVPVEGTGTVIRVLSDDREGSPHQRFVLRLASGQTLLVVHNLDIAQRVPELAVGDEIAFKGEYVWDERGGLVHWTHHDPSGRHQTGYLRKGSAVFR